MYLYFFVSNNNIMKKIKSELILEVAKATKINQGFQKKVTKHSHNITQTDILLFDEVCAKKIGREVGNYSTFDFDDLLFFDIDAKNILCNKLKLALSNIVKKNNISAKTILVVGLGNEKYACDSLGKSVVDRVLVTKPYLEKSLFSPKKMAEIYAVSLGVYGTTGLETSDTIKSICQTIKPNLVIVVDSLVAGSTKTLAKSIQISDTKLAPGGGVGNNRKEVSQKVLGVKVVAIGVPLVVNLSNICKTNDNLIVTPKDVEQKVADLSKIISKSINLAFNNLSQKELLQLTA